MESNTNTLDTPQAAADYLGTSPRTLSYWRATKQGPAYVRLGRVIRYRRSDLAAFVEQNTVRPAAA